MILRTEKLCFTYPSGNTVLRDVSLEMKPGTVTAVFGPNGCGKSTLVRCLNGSLMPQSGVVELDGQPIHQLGRRAIAQIIAVVAQEPVTGAPFHVSEMVLLGRYPHTTGWQPTGQDRQVVQESLARLQIQHLADRPFTQLSGGERQRVTLARCLAQQSPILLLDEPATHLDIAHQLELYRLLRQLAGEGQTILAVCHDLILSPLFADAAVLLDGGQIQAQGRPEEVLTPCNLRQAFGVALQIDWQQSTEVRLTIPPV